MAVALSRERLVELAVVATAVLIALLSARGPVGGWNDGSRLATVECLVDYHTLAIDRSVFTPGTGDKLFINGHFYSDKSPVPAVLMSVAYQICQWCLGLTAREQPERFGYLMTVVSSGLAYVVAVWCVYRLGRTLNLSLSLGLALTVSFALATVALPYVRHVNNHILLLAVASAVMLLLVDRQSAIGNRQSAIPLGTLAGLAYAIDLGAGPVLLVCTLALVAYRARRPVPVMAFVAAALPWLVLHHVLNYAVGGTFKPANAVPEYFEWPGCAFNARNLTGGWKHGDIGHFLSYAAALLVGKRGFLGHDLPLFLAVAGFVVLLRRRLPERPELLFAGCWCAGTWLMYAVNSNNHSGLCCSVRWLVPLAAPGYYVLAVLLRRCPQYQGDFLLLSGWGLVLGALMWWHGPWAELKGWYYWPIQAAALLSWTGYRIWLRRRQRETTAQEPPRLARAA